MDENEIDKASQRANLIEQRMFEITLSSLDTLKHSTAVELHKSQNEMKKRLRKYRDRQREIVRAKPDFDTDPIEELITRQMRNKAKARMQTRPKTCPAGLRRLTPKSTDISSKPDEMTSEVTHVTSNGSSALTNGVSPRINGTKSEHFEESYSDEFSDEEHELDGSFMIDQQKSKIDLRPKTAVEISRRGLTLDKYANVGRLGSAVKQVRYFDEDELNDRGHFYRHLVEKRIKEEKNKLSSLDDKVAEFCGSETIQTMIKKMQSKTKLFTRNQEWSDGVNSKPRTKGGQRKQASNTNTQSEKRIRSHIRPSTSVGFREGNGVTTLNSFRKPSYIAT